MDQCNAAMYWVNMPGYENGSPYAAEWGNYYCDANFVNGNWCSNSNLCTAL